eukprot:11922239-Karenia_brevis.AAC.1
MHEIFFIAQQTAGLTLGASKCVLVPLVDSDFDGVSEYLGSWLRRWLPSWASFQICLSAEYLGIAMGPSAASKQWVKPVTRA